jgi:hypothetical protein
MEGVAWTERIPTLEHLERASSDQLKEFLQSSATEDNASTVKTVIASAGLRELRRHVVAAATEQGHSLPQSLRFKLSPLQRCPTEVLCKLLASCVDDFDKIMGGLSQEDLLHKCIELAETGKFSSTVLDIKRGEGLRKSLTEKYLDVLYSVLQPATFCEEAKAFLEWTRRDAEAAKESAILRDRVTWLSEKFGTAYDGLLYNFMNDTKRFLSLHVIAFMDNRPDLLFPQHFVHVDSLMLHKLVSGPVLAPTLSEENVNEFFFPVILQKVKNTKRLLGMLDLRKPQEEALLELQKYWESNNNHSFSAKSDDLLKLDMAMCRFRSWFRRALELSYVECSSLDENTEIPPGEAQMIEALFSLQRVDRLDAPLIVLPTGVGKSTVLYLAPLTMRLERCPKRVLIVIHRKLIRDALSEGVERFYHDFVDTLESQAERSNFQQGLFAGDPSKSHEAFSSTDFPRIRVFCIDKGVQFVASLHSRYDVIALTIQTFSSQKHFFPRDFFDMVLVDEAHHIEAHSYKLMREHFCRTPFVLVTGTPERRNGEPISATTIHHTELPDVVQQKCIKNVCWSPLPVEKLYVSCSDGSQIALDYDSLNRASKSFQTIVRQSTEAKVAVIGHCMKLLRCIRTQTRFNHQVIVQASDAYEAAEVVYLWRQHAEGYVEDENCKTGKEELPLSDNDVLDKLEKLSVSDTSSYVSAPESVPQDKQLDEFVASPDSLALDEGSNAWKGTDFNPQNVDSPEQRSELFEWQNNDSWSDYRSTDHTLTDLKVDNGCRRVKIDFVACSRTADENKQVIESLKSGDLDIIVHVDILGEGFDHPPLSICCIFRRFTYYAPFAQFVGRAIRWIRESDDPTTNTSYVVSHPGLGLYDLWCEMKSEGDAVQRIPLPKVNLKHVEKLGTHVLNDDLLAHSEMLVAK